MIDTPTVFVLGAGASVPYWFPTGEELSKQISSTLREGRFHDEGPSTRPGPHGNLYAELKRIAKGNGLRELEDGLSEGARNTIDSFLAINSDLMELGIHAIAHCLFVCRRQRPVGTEEAGALAGERWYTNLFRAMAGQGSHKEFRHNKVGVITFNYDCSFEHGLITYLRYTYPRADPDELASIASQFAPVHVHGKLEGLLWEPKNLDPGPDQSLWNDSPSITRAAHGINIPVVAEASSPASMRASEMIMAAQRVFFLGFGYDETNLAHLGITPETPIRTTSRGTCMGMPKWEREELRGLRIVCEDPTEMRIPEFLRVHAKIK